MSERRRDVLCAAILALLPALLFADVLLGIHDFYVRDVARYHYPVKMMLRQVVLGGEFPYWNRFINAGQPLAANPEHELFYPPSWLIFLPNALVGFRLLALTHVSLLLVATFALLRSMQRSRAAAVFGAVSFGLGGLALAHLNLWPFLFSLAWLPLTCLFIRRFLATHARRDFALAVLSLTMQLLIAEPTTALQTGILAGAYALTRAPRLRNVAWVGAIGLAAFVAASAQTLPTIVFFRDSVRARGLDFELVRHWSLPPLRFAELAFPHFFGHVLVGDEMAWWGGAYYDGAPFFLSIYCGLGAVLLALTGLLVRERGAKLFAFLFGASAILALGAHTPLLRFLYDAGIARSTRFPEKFVVLGVFAMVVFAAKVLDRLLAGDERVSRVALRAAIGFAAVSALVSVLSFSDAYANAFTALWHLPRRFDPFLALSQRDWLIATARAVLVVILVRSVATMKRAAWLALAALFLALDLAPLAPEIAPRTDASFYVEAPAAQLPRGARLFHEADWTQDEDARLYRRPAPELAWVMRNGLFPMLPAALGVQTVIEPDFDRTAQIPTAEFTSAVWELAQKRDDWRAFAMTMAGANFRAEYRPYAVARAEAGGDLRRIQPVRFRQARVARYWFAPAIVPIRDRHDFVAQIATGRFEPRTAFVEAAHFAPARGVVRSWSETANTATIDVTCEGRAFLVMSVAWHRWWRITIDGKPAVPIRTNLAFQGIAVPPGNHVVRMRFRDPIVDAGALVTAVSILALALLARRR